MRVLMFSKVLLITSSIYSSYTFQMGYFGPKDKVLIQVACSLLSTGHLLFPRHQIISFSKYLER